MFLRYIMGGPSTGKTKFCVDEIIKLEASENILFIVPEQASLQTEKKLIERVGSIINTQVLSFQRLSFHIFSELGNAKKILLEDIGKNMLLRKILSDTKLKFFSGITKRAGFIDNLSSIISEFYKYEISPQKLNDCLKDLPGNLKFKLGDLYLVYKKYTDYIREKYLSRDEILDVLAQKICQSKFLQGIKIFMDGFDSFNMQEYRVIEELMKVAGGIFLTAGIHLNQGHGIEYRGIKITEPYYEIKNTINNLTKLARENNLEIAAPLSLKKIYKENSELEFLTNNYFYIYASEYAQPTENIFLYEANDLYREVNFIAEKIIGYVKNNGVRFNEIAIVVGDMGKYSAAFERIFETFAIPFFIDKKIGIMTNQLVEFIRAALDIIIFNFSYESVFAFLKNNLAGFDLDDVDLLENYVLEFGIKGELWKKNWAAGFNKYQPDEISRVKNLVTEKLNFITQNLSAARSYKISWLCEFVFEILDVFDIQNKLAADVNAEENLKVWNKICELFDKIVDVFGDDNVDVKKFVQILDEGLKKIDLGLIPKFIDQIIIGDVERSRIPDVKILFIAGANEGAFSGAKNENQIVTEDEKIFLNSVGLRFSEGRNYKIYKNNFLLYGLISKPTCQLNISYCMKNVDEKQIYPHEIFNKIQSLFPDVIIKSIEEKNIGQIDFKNLPAEKLQTCHEKLNVSVSQLEQFAKCPFAYFLKYDLKLRPRKIYQLKSVDIGSFLHAVLKEFFLLVKDFSACEKNIDEYIQMAIERCDFDESIFFESAYYKFLLFHIKNVLRNSITAMLNNFADENYRPIHFEFPFSNIKLDHNIFLEGKIDRIDLLELNGQKFLRVIDYKSSAKKFSLNDIADGLQLQLLMYLKVLAQGDIKPGGAFYFHLANHFVDVQNEINDADLQKKINDKFKMNGPDSQQLDELMQMAVDSAKTICENIMAGNINIKPHDKFVCAYCPYFSICRKERDFLC